MIGSIEQISMVPKTRGPKEWSCTTCGTGHQVFRSSGGREFVWCGTLRIYSQEAL